MCVHHHLDLDLDRARPRLPHQRRSRRRERHDGCDRGERGDRGASLVEYALLIALIALAAFLSLRYFGDSRDNSLSRSGSAIAGLVRPPALP